MDQKTMKQLAQKEEKTKTRAFFSVMLLCLLLVCLVLAAPLGQAHARDKYARGRTLYIRRCGPCFSMGWKWAPSARAQDKKKWNLLRMARQWSPAQVCTWMRKNKRKLRGPGCYPGRIPPHERLTILYYLTRRLEGRIPKPRLQKIMPKRAKKLRLKHRAPARRRKAQKRHQNRLQLRRMRRRRSGRWSGSLKPPKNRPRTSGRLLRRKYFKNRRHKNRNKNARGKKSVRRQAPEKKRRGDQDTRDGDRNRRDER
jgi:hypothetical protein